MKILLKRVIEWNYRVALNAGVLREGISIKKNARIYRAVFEGNNIIGEGSNVVRSSFGKYSYCGERCSLPFTKVGRFCSIASDVVLACGMHPIHYVSTSPATYSKSFPNALCKDDLGFKEYAYTDETGEFYCEIGNDVWIATRATLVCGTKALKIGDGAIICAGAVVTKDVPPYAVVSGCPATIKKYRFEQETIGLLNKIKWWDREQRWLEQSVSDFCDIAVFLKKNDSIK